MTCRSVRPEAAPVRDLWCFEDDPKRSRIVTRMADEPLTLAVLARFHREVIVPDIERAVGNATSGLRDEMHGLFDALSKHIDSLETEYEMLKAGLQRVEDRLGRIEQRLDKMALRSDLLDLKARVEALEEQIRTIEARLEC
jgi:predicted nuclease with TOPRIM domain